MPASTVSKERSSRNVFSSVMSPLLSRFQPTNITVPPAPSVLLSNPRETYHIQRPRERSRDSPLATIYRIYWAIVMDDTISMRNEIEYFWSRKEKSWNVLNVPPPHDQDPERFAIVSAIPFILAAAFNRLINLGLPRNRASNILTSEEMDELNLQPRILEGVPQWAINAPPLSHPLLLPSAKLGSPQSADVEAADPFMALKNVLVWRLHIMFT